MSPLLPRQHPQCILHPLHVYARQLRQRLVAHQALVRNGADLVYQQISFLLHRAQLAH